MTITMENKDNLVRVSDYARMREVTVTTVNRWIQTNKVAFEIIGGTYFIDVLRTNTILLFNKNHVAKVKWFEFFFNKFGFNPKWGAKEASNIKRLIEYMDSISDKKSLEMFEYILQKWDTLPVFVRDKKDISILYQNINEVLSNLKNGKQDNHSNTLKTFADIRK